MKKIFIGFSFLLPLVTIASEVRVDIPNSSEIVSTFLTLAGFVIGLGAVTVIDWHGFLARKSSYWTEATIRSHKVTKPLIWVGTILVVIGGALLYSSAVWNNLATGQTLILIILILNGLFLSFSISPYLLKQEKVGKSSELLPQKIQKRIIISFLVSFFGWWGLLFSFVWYLLVLR